jgi:hypothetical protein
VSVPRGKYRPEVKLTRAGDAREKFPMSDPNEEDELAGTSSPSSPTWWSCATG